MSSEKNRSEKMPLLFLIKAFDKNTILKLTLILILLSLFLNIPKKYLGDTYPICLYRIVFKQKCIGCGTTRAVWSILHFKFNEAIEYNKLIIITFPLLFGNTIHWVFKRGERKNMMFCKKCGSKINDNVRFCFECGTEVNDNITVHVQQKNKLKPNSSVISKKSFFMGMSITAVVFAIILGITIFTKAENKNPPVENYINENSIEDTIWEYSTGLSLFGLGTNKNITIEFTATKYILTNTSKLGFGKLGIDFPSAETGSYTIVDDNIIILVPDSGYSDNLASLSELKKDIGENLSTFFDKLLSFFSDEEITDKSIIDNSGQDKHSESRKYTGLLTRRTLVISDKTFKRK